MEYLWCPWRMEYIKSDKHTDDCVFCVELSRPDGPENLIVYRGRRAFVILNRYPYTSGHLMIVPFDHYASLEELDAADACRNYGTDGAIDGYLAPDLPAGRLNIGINIGAAAGAGVLDHVHLHVVPRWNGDTNFMSSLADTRVIPEALDETYLRVCQAWVSGA